MHPHNDYNCAVSVSSITLSSIAVPSSNGYDDQEKSSHMVATISSEIEQQNDEMFSPETVTSSIAPSLQNASKSNVSFLSKNTDSSEASPSCTGIDSNGTSVSSKIPSHCFYQGSNSISSLSSTTATQYRKVPFTFIPFEKKDIKKNAEKFHDTEYARVLFPALIVRTDKNERVRTLMTLMLDNRKFIKDTAQKIYEDEIKTRFSFMNIDKEVENLRLLDSAKAIWKYYENKHGTDWRSMMIETSPIFLSPAILNKTWISRVRTSAESTLQFIIVKDLTFDAERSYDFAHTISQKHVKDMTTKLYKRFLDKFGMKLLTKKPKNGIFPVNGGEICINHETFDKELKRTNVFCVSSEKNPLYDETKTKFTDSFDHDAIVTYIDEIVDNLSRGKFKFIIEK
jgi:hypothetical protein